MNKRRPNCFNVPRTAFMVLLAFLLAWGSVPVPALAEMLTEVEEGIVVEPGDSEGTVANQGSQASGFIEVRDGDSGVSNDELFKSYIQQQFDMKLPESADDFDVTIQSAGEYLTESEYAVYDVIKGVVQQVALGEQSSTVIELPLSEVLSKDKWKFAEVGIANPLSNGVITQEAKEAISAKWSQEVGTIVDKAMDAVWADCPYEMYWYGRAYGTSFGYSYSSEDFIFTKASLRIKVASNYAAGDYNIDTTLAQSVQTAVNRATTIANDHKNEVASVRLASYKQEICNLVEYNDAALEAGSIATYGSNNPWELVWVFDGDITTDVVCEGYSKAFKYLCDLSGRTDVECLTVTGLLGNVLNTSEMGGHMWNVVRMPDSKNYLIDVTNCDEGSAGNPDYLFLKGYVEGGYANNYYGFTTLSKTGKNYFMYDGETKSTYPQSDLELSSTNYDPANDPTTEKQSISPEVTIQGWTYGQAANTPQLTEGSNPGNGTVTFEYKVAGSDDNTYTNAVPTNANSYIVRATIAETDTYLSGTATADFTISKATPNLGTVTAGSVVDDLDVSKVVLSRTNTSVAGTLSLTETILSYGTNTYHWTFTPSDTTNYNSCDGTVSITVSGHNWGAAEYVWAANKGSVTATRVCANNSAHKETETVSTTSEVTAAATCKEPGVLTYTATFLNAAFATQTENVEIPATGQHTWGDWHVTTPPTATQAGEETRECSVCHDTETRDMDPLGQNDISDATVTLSASSFTYDGTAHQPAVTVTLGGTALGAGDYAVSYRRGGEATSDLASAGAVTVVATGQGDYTGSASADLTISPRQLTLAWTGTQLAYDGTSKKPAATVGNAAPGEAVTATVSGAATGAGTHTATATISFGGASSGNYLQPSNLSTQFTISPLSIADDAVTVGQIADQTATGKELMPEPAVTFGGKALDKGTDYTLGYSNNVGPGTATITITGKGNFSGSRTATFQIVGSASPQPTNISGATIELDQESFTYDGSELEPGVTVSLNGAELDWPFDYEVAYQNNVNAGTATVVVTGCGDYTGTARKDFAIAKADQDIDLLEDVFRATYGDEPFELDVLDWSVDGAISYKSSNAKVATVDAAGKVAIVGAGTATITVTAAGTCNYNEAKVTAQVTIAKASNPIKASAKHAGVTTTYSPAKAVATAGNVAVSKAHGAVTYANASTNATAKKFLVNKSTGKVTVPKATSAGTYAVIVKVTAAGNANYEAGSKAVSYKVVVNKAANPMTVKAGKKTASFSTLKKKAVAVKCPVTVSKAQGKVTYAKAGGSAVLTINKNTGKVTVKKGTKKGTYSIKIKVTAAGNGNYKAATKTVTGKVVVR
ncbi:MAG: MBG domain-containing protein [Coriobacteriales bacterium]|nr:MBG domain-containing protein [Coriobacteriales bacterium]